MAPGNQDYKLPHNYQSPDQIRSTPPVENPVEQRTYFHEDLEDTQSEEGWVRYKERRQDDLEYRQSEAAKKSHVQDGGDEYHLTELAAPPPVDRKDETSPRMSGSPSLPSPTPEERMDHRPFHSYTRASKLQTKISKLQTKISTVSYLIFFSILGTLARLGLQALTAYPGAPVTTGVLWANFGGSLLMGFFLEDCQLFRTHSYARTPLPDGPNSVDPEKRTPTPSDDAVAKKQHASDKKIIPLYIGLTTGFCGSFTSYSSFMRDVFLALSNSLPTPVSHTQIAPASSSYLIPRNGGYSFMALVAVIVLTVSLSLGALQIGGHLALAIEPITPSISFSFTRKILDKGMVFLAWGCWIAAIFMAIWPPDRPGGTLGDTQWDQETWRGKVLYALVFAPIGCLLRFYVSLNLNGRVVSFPTGTFTVNMLGTALEGMFWDLQHVPRGGRVGCQVLQGMMDGFCGCLTTVSTWVAELKGLRRRHAYIYGGISLVVGLGLMIVTMGSLKWTKGFADAVCVV